MLDTRNTIESAFSISASQLFRSVRWPPTSTSVRLRRGLTSKGPYAFWPTVGLRQLRMSPSVGSQSFEKMRATSLKNL